MKIKNLSNHSFLYRYLVSFLLVLFLPIIALSFLMKTRIFNLLQKEISQNNLELLKNTAHLFENDLASMEQIVTQIMLTSCFYTEKTTSDVTRLSECQNILSIYTTSGSSFRTIAISWENIPYLYSSYGSCSIHLLDTDDPMYPDFSEDFSFQIASARKNPLNPREEDMLLFAYPVHFSRSKQNARILFLTEADRYYAESDPSRAESDTAYYIFYKDQLICSNTKGMPFPAVDTDTLPDFSEAFAQKINIEDAEMLLCMIPSTHHDFTFFSLTPLKTAMAASNQLQRSFLLYVIISSLIALGVIAVNLHLNYKPLRNLFYSVRHLLNSNQKHLNEVTSIQSAFDNISSENRKLLSDTKENRAEKILTDLLKGFYSPAKPIPASDLAAISFQPQHSLFMACIFRFHESAHESLFDTQKKHPVTLRTLSVTMENFFDLFLIKDNHDKTFSVLVNLENGQVQKLEILRQMLVDSCHLAVTVSAGSLYPDLYDSPLSYMEALYTMDYRFIRGNDCTLLASDVAIQEDWSEFYPRQDLAKFRRMLSTRNLSTPAQIDEQLNYILNYIRTCDVPMFAARSICFEIINSILSSMSDEELKSNKSYLTHLSHFDTVEEMLASLGMICHNLFAFSEKNTACTSDLITQMKIYVDSNYADCNFSLQEMADYFNMGMTNLSQFFKRQTGSTLIDYYTRLRMEKAGILLEDQSRKIDDIAASVGYLNTSSFIRRFKQYYGISPRQYVPPAE